MRIEGKCHCGNVGFTLQWPAGVPIAARLCTCSFCTKHGGAWTSHRDAELAVHVRDESELNRYRFGTGTAEFYVCARCGIVPVVTSRIDEHLYAVVNVNTFEGIDLTTLSRSSVSFDGEGTGDRLGRRQRNWIHAVKIAVGAG